MPSIIGLETWKVRLLTLIFLLRSFQFTSLDPRFFRILVYPYNYRIPFLAKPYRCLFILCPTLCPLPKLGHFKINKQ